MRILQRILHINVLYEAYTRLCNLTKLFQRPIILYDQMKNIKKLCPGEIIGLNELKRDNKNA